MKRPASWKCASWIVAMIVGCSAPAPTTPPIAQKSPAPVSGDPPIAPIEHRTNRTSSTPPTAASQPGRLLSVVDVRTFGAVLDGKTDDAWAVQRAINSLPDSGGVVRVPGLAGIGARGILVLNRKDITIEGVGESSGFCALAETPPINMAAFGPTMLRIEKSAGCVVQNLFFDGNKVNINIIGVATSKNVVVRGNTIVNVGSRIGAIVAGGNVGNQYLDNSISDTAVPTRGMWIGNWLAAEIEYNAIISGNVIKRCGATGIGTDAGATVTRNLVESCAGAGVAIVPAIIDIRAQTLIEQNVFRKNLFHGIQSDSMFDNRPVVDVVARDNLCEQNVKSGMYIVRASGWKLIGNTCRDNGMAGGFGAGIVLERARDILIKENICEETREKNKKTQLIGISLIAQTAPNELDGIEITANEARGNAKHGILITTSGAGTIRNVIVKDNECEENGEYGLLVPATAAGQIGDLQIGKNTFSNNGKADQRVDPAVGLKKP